MARLAKEDRMHHESFSWNVQRQTFGFLDETDRWTGFVSPPPDRYLIFALPTKHKLYSPKRYPQPAAVPHKPQAFLEPPGAPT